MKSGVKKSVLSVSMEKNGCRDDRTNRATNQPLLSLSGFQISLFLSGRRKSFSSLFFWILSFPSSVAGIRRGRKDHQLTVWWSNNEENTFFEKRRKLLPRSLKKTGTEKKNLKMRSKGRNTKILHKRSRGVKKCAVLDLYLRIFNLRPTAGKSEFKRSKIWKATPAWARVASTTSSLLDVCSAQFSPPPPPPPPPSSSHFLE